MLFRGDAQILPQLKARLEREPNRGRVTAVVCAQEVIAGWMSHINSARTPDELLLGYERLRVAIEKCSTMSLLPYDATAHEMFESLRKMCRRLGTMDLRVAAVALTNNATLLTRNLRDFRQVPGLRVEDWSRAA